MVEPSIVLDSSDVPVGKVLAGSLRLVIQSDCVGSALIRFTMATRHFSSQLPYNERISHRLNLEWLVISEDAGEVLGVISQSDHSYRHPEIVLSLPRDRTLVLIPSAPYLCDAALAVEAVAIPLGLGEPRYRYEVEVGAAADAGVIGGQWSYREGHLPFQHWFHNKAFRWGFDGATLRLPAVPGAAMWVAVNALCRTEIEVWAGDVHLTTLGKISGSDRWHDEAYGFVVPAEVVVDDEVELAFRFAKSRTVLIDFNLRQDVLAMSRVIVDVFEKDCSALPERLASRLWRDPVGATPSLGDDLTDPDGDHGQAQAALLAAPIEFSLVGRYFAPHSHFWTTMRGVIAGFQANGVTMSLLPANAPADVLARFESCVVGPIRFDQALGERLRGDPSLHAAVVAPTTGSLAALGFAMDEGLLSAFGYRELFDVALPDGGKGNFWELALVRPGFWSEERLGWGGTTLIGRAVDTPWTLLASASAEDWMEMGDPASRAALDVFVGAASTPRAVTAGGRPCGLRVRDGALVLVAAEARTALRASGGGIARGWPDIEIDAELFDEQRLPVLLHGRALPASGVVAEALRQVRDQVARATLTSGRHLRFPLQAPEAP